MPTKRKTLKKKISKYICDKVEQDICCEKDIDRDIVIQQIFSIYLEIATFMGDAENYIEYINNDIIVPIGFKIDLERENDTRGIKLWNEIIKFSRTKQKIIAVLKQVPLYYIMTFLGYATHKLYVTKNASSINS